MSWDFEVAKAGKYEVEVQQGCGSSGGSEVVVEVAGQAVKFTVDATGNFQSFAQRVVGVVDLGEGRQTLAVKPQSKVGAAVMDLRRGGAATGAPVKEARRRACHPSPGARTVRRRD
ncbi:MAG: hypothetical protein WDN28_07040 [Chthoniobacter sp.]